MSTSSPNQRGVICLWGFMGTGKSTVGALLAERTDAELIDLDARIEEQERTTISEIFAERGEAAFRELEATHLDQILDDAARAENRPVVVALGGGALVDGARRQAVLARAFVVTLHAALETILARLAGNDTRPLLAGVGRSRARALWEGRRAAYTDVHTIIETDDRTPGAVAERLSKLWQPR